jgi:hypothetical protein
MKQGTYNTIRHWDENVVFKFVSKELEELHNYFKKIEMKELSFIDIGGNVGKFYDELSKRYFVKKCEIVEASNFLCEYMNDKYEGSPNVTIHNLGLSDEAGVFYFGDEGIRWFEDNDQDGTGQEVNLGLSASNFVHHDKSDYQGATKFYTSGYFLEKINKIPPGEIGFIKVDTENRDVQIVSGMKNYLVKNKINPIILFENNFRYFLSADQAQKLINNVCEEVGYEPVNLLNSQDNIFLIPRIIK